MCQDLNKSRETTSRNFGLKEGMTVWELQSQLTVDKGKPSKEMAIKIGKE